MPASTNETDYYTDNHVDVPSSVTYKQTISGVTTTLASFSYVADSTGAVYTETDTGIGTNQTYVHDTIEQMTASGSTSTPTSYAYDKASNITNRGTTSGGSASTLGYHAGDELCWTIASTITSPSCTSVPTGATTYTYDASGDRTVTTPSTGSATHYAYNEAHQLATYTAPSGTATTYTYDGDGLRASKTTSGGTTYFVWDHAAATPLLLSDGINYYVYGEGDVPLEQISVASGTTYWLHHDQMDSTRAITSSSGTIVGTATYDPWGLLASSSGSVTTPLGFQGQYTDTESGLVYLRARYYDPTTAQFLTVDPNLTQAGQPYAYALNNPLNNADPSGRTPCTPYDIEEGACI